MSESSLALQSVLSGLVRESVAAHYPVLSGPVCGIAPLLVITGAPIGSSGLLCEAVVAHCSVLSGPVCGIQCCSMLGPVGPFARVQCGSLRGPGRPACVSPTRLIARSRRACLCESGAAHYSVLSGPVCGIQCCSMLGPVGPFARYQCGSLLGPVRACLR